MRPRLVIHKKIAKRLEGIVLRSAYVELGKVAGATFGGSLNRQLGWGLGHYKDRARKGRDRGVLDFVLPDRT
jgi:hypothetical protein